METCLNKPTLVLNAAWNAITIASVRHAICKVTAGFAKILDPETYITYNFWGWVNLEPEDERSCITMTRERKIRVPEIIILEKYDKFPSRVVRLTRRNLLIRDSFRCQYTGKRVTGKDATLDHVVPVSKGGKHTWDNIVVASLDANSRKADRTPEQAGMKLLKKPVEPRWSPIYARFSRVAISESYPDSWHQFLPKDKQSNWHPEDYWDVDIGE